MDAETAISAGQPHEISRERLVRIAESHHARRCEAIALELGFVGTVGTEAAATGSAIPLRRNTDGTIMYV